jgi:hypothetical protein
MAPTGRLYIGHLLSGHLHSKLRIHHDMYQLTRIRQIYAPKPSVDTAGPTGLFFHEFPLNLQATNITHLADYAFESSLKTFSSWDMQEISPRQSTSSTPELPDTTTKGKRKAGHTDVYAEHTGKKSRRDTHDAPKSANDGSQDPLKRRVKQSGKRTRYANLEGVKDAQLPDYSNVSLSFSTRDAALSSIRQQLNGLQDAFLPPESDPSIPQTDGQRQNAVRTILGAMKDVTNAKDANNSGFNSRWAADAPRPCKDPDLETTCW